jgi:hypothetical protein
MSRVNIKDIKEETLQRYYNWPESKDYSVLHLVNISSPPP